MDIQKKIKQWLKHNDGPPWPIGVDLIKASDDAKFAMALLSSEELVAISRFNKFKIYRNELMRKLKWQHGIPVNVMAELTGLSIGTVKVIIPRKKALKNE